MDMWTSRPLRRDLELVRSNRHNTSNSTDAAAPGSEESRHWTSYYLDDIAARPGGNGNSVHVSSHMDDIIAVTSTRIHVSPYIENNATTTPAGILAQNASSGQTTYLPSSVDLSRAIGGGRASSPVSGAMSSWQSSTEWHSRGQRRSGYGPAQRDHWRTSRWPSAGRRASHDAAEAPYWSTASATTEWQEEGDPNDIHDDMRAGRDLRRSHYDERTGYDAPWRPRDSDHSYSRLAPRDHVEQAQHWQRSERARSPEEDDVASTEQDGRDARSLRQRAPRLQGRSIVPPAESEDVTESDAVEEPSPATYDDESDAVSYTFSPTDADFARLNGVDEAAQYVTNNTVDLGDGRRLRGRPTTRPTVAMPPHEVAASIWAAEIDAASEQAFRNGEASIVHRAADLGWNHEVASAVRRGRRAWADETSSSDRERSRSRREGRDADDAQIRDAEGARGGGRASAPSAKSARAKRTARAGKPGPPKELPESEATVAWKPSLYDDDESEMTHEEKQRLRALFDFKRREDPFVPKSREFYEEENGMPKMTYQDTKGLEKFKGAHGETYSAYQGPVMSMADSWNHTLSFIKELYEDREAEGALGYSHEELGRDHISFSNMANAALTLHALEPGLMTTMGLGSDGNEARGPRPEAVYPHIHLDKGYPKKGGGFTGRAFKEDELRTSYFGIPPSKLYKLARVGTAGHCTRADRERQLSRYRPKYPKTLDDFKAGHCIYVTRRKATAARYPQDFYNDHRGQCGELCVADGTPPLTAIIQGQVAKWDENGNSTVLWDRNQGSNQQDMIHPKYFCPQVVHFYAQPHAYRPFRANGFAADGMGLSHDERVASNEIQRDGIPPQLHTSLLKSLGWKTKEVNRRMRQVDRMTLPTDLPTAEVPAVNRRRLAARRIVPLMHKADGSLETQAEADARFALSQTTNAAQSDSDVSDGELRRRQVAEAQYWRRGEYKAKREEQLREAARKAKRSAAETEALVKDIDHDDRTPIAVAEERDEKRLKTEQTPGRDLGNDTVTDEKPSAPVGEPDVRPGHSRHGDHSVTTQVMPEPKVKRASRARITQRFPPPNEELRGRLATKLDSKVHCALELGEVTWITDTKGYWKPDHCVHQFMKHNLRDGSKIDRRRGVSLNDLSNVGPGSWQELFEMLPAYRARIHRRFKPWISPRSQGDAMEIICGIAYTAAQDCDNIPDDQELRFPSEEARRAWLEVWLIFELLGIKVDNKAGTEYDIGRYTEAERLAEAEVNVVRPPPPPAYTRATPPPPPSDNAETKVKSPPPQPADTREPPLPPPDDIQRGAPTNTEQTPDATHDDGVLPPQPNAGRASDTGEGESETERAQQSPTARHAPHVEERPTTDDEVEANETMRSDAPPNEDDINEAYATKEARAALLAKVFEPEPDAEEHAPLARSACTKRPAQDDDNGGEATQECETTSPAKQARQGDETLPQRTEAPAIPTAEVPGTTEPRETPPATSVEECRLPEAVTSDRTPAIPKPPTTISIERINERLRELRRGASVQEIESACRKLALECHPDKFPDDSRASKIFQEISDHREDLLIRRRAFDEIVAGGVRMLRPKQPPVQPHPGYVAPPRVPSTTPKQPPPDYATATDPWLTSHYATTVDPWLTAHAKAPVPMTPNDPRLVRSVPMTPGAAPATRPACSGGGLGTTTTAPSVPTTEAGTKGPRVDPAAGRASGSGRAAPENEKRPPNIVPKWQPGPLATSPSGAGDNRLPPRDGPGSEAKPMMERVKAPNASVQSQRTTKRVRADTVNPSDRRTWRSCAGDCGLLDTGAAEHGFCCGACREQPGEHGHGCKRMNIPVNIEGEAIEAADARPDQFIGLGHCRHGRDPGVCKICSGDEQEHGPYPDLLLFRPKGDLRPMTQPDIMFREPHKTGFTVSDSSMRMLVDGVLPRFYKVRCGRNVGAFSCPGLTAIPDANQYKATTFYTFWKLLGGLKSCARIFFVDRSRSIKDTEWGKAQAKQWEGILQQLTGKIVMLPPVQEILNKLDFDAYGETSYEVFTDAYHMTRAATNAAHDEYWDEIDRLMQESGEKATHVPVMIWDFNAGSKHMKAYNETHVAFWDRLARWGEVESFAAKDELKESLNRTLRCDSLPEDWYTSTLYKVCRTTKVKFETPGRKKNDSTVPRWTTLDETQANADHESDIRWKPALEDHGETTALPGQPALIRGVVFDEKQVHDDFDALGLPTDEAGYVEWSRALEDLARCCGDEDKATVVQRARGKYRAMFYALATEYKIHDAPKFMMEALKVAANEKSHAAGRASGSV